MPDALRGRLEERGHAVRTIAIEGEAVPALRRDASVRLADAEGAVRLIGELGITHLVLIGSIGRRPRWTEGRLGPRSLMFAWNAFRSLSKGDDAMLRAVVSAFERIGVTVVGVHDLWPELLPAAGAIGRHRPSKRAHGEIALAHGAARALGEFDVGQGAVAVGQRVVALEGLEGTDAMLARVADLRSAGRLVDRAPSGVLVKVAKPMQEVRTDLPTIGPNTMLGARDAGLAGVAVGAGAALLVDRDEALRVADEAGLFVWGIDVAG